MVNNQTGLKRLIFAHAVAGGLPGAYQRADYLECTGYNARIDTGVAGDNETLRFQFDYMALNAGNYAGHFGNYVDENTKCWRLIQSVTTSPRVFVVSLGNRKAGSGSGFSAVSAETGTIVGARINFELTYGHCVTKCTDGTNINFSAETDSSPANSSNIAIGSRNVSTTGGSIKGRFWYVKIWDGDTLIRDYVPCVRKSDSKAGFYDMVNKTFNPSIGSADFIAGMDS